MPGFEPLSRALRLAPEYREYVWGGNRLRPGRSPTAEAWVVHEQDRIVYGSLAGQTLGQVAGVYGEALLGRRAVQRTGARFPLLIKLLDCAQWLSLQVHPNDEQAAQLEGAGHFGKTEAWHILDAAPDAEILCGLRPGIHRDELAQAIRGGTILDSVQRLMVKTGDTVFIAPGTLHALGPGLLVYEVQQTSDITYRVFDWNRPASQGRKLHIEQSLAVADVNASGRAIPRPQLADGDRQVLVACAYFTLEILSGRMNSISLDTGGESFHALTLIEGKAQIKGMDWEEPLNHFETVIVPAACGAYHVEPGGFYRALLATV
jgi:mannose-6-phosphate isomerase